MIRPNPPGRPPTLNDEMIAYVISFVPSNHSVVQVSRVSGIPHRTLCKWLDDGKRDLEEGTDSIYARFSLEFNQSVGREINSLLTEMRMIGNYQSISWLLEKCYPEDYGTEAPQMKEFREMFRQVTETRNMGNGTETEKA